MGDWEEVKTRSRAVSVTEDKAWSLSVLWMCNSTSGGQKETGIHRTWGVMNSRVEHSGGGPQALLARGPD